MRSPASGFEGWRAMSGKLIAYYRDDSDPRYGLGLEEQAAAVRIYAHAYDAEVIGSYRDIRGVRWRHRPELARAIAHAQRAHARLIFPTLEGPFGNPEVLRLLIEAGVEFGVCGRPEVSERTLPSFAKLAPPLLRRARASRRRRRRVLTRPGPSKLDARAAVRGSVPAPGRGEERRANCHVASPHPDP